MVAYVRGRLARCKGCLGVRACQLQELHSVVYSVQVGYYAFCFLAFSLSFMRSVFCDHLANFALHAESPRLSELGQR